MFIENKINNFFSLKISYLILFSVCALFIALSNVVYTYEVELSKQDAASYILVAQDLSNYFKVEHQEAIRFFPSFVVNIFSKITSINIEKSFKILVYLSFFLLIFKIFKFLQTIKLKNYISLSIIASSVFSIHSILYTIFNFYQFLDLLLYIFVIYFLELANENKVFKLFIISLLAILTKEFLIILSIAAFLNQYFNFKDKKIFVYIFIIIAIFLGNSFLVRHYNSYASPVNLTSHIGDYFSNYSLFISSAVQSLFYEKNIFLFFPFFIILLSKNFYMQSKKYLFSIPYLIIPIGFSVLLYNYVGANFFRVFYQGYFIVVLLSLAYLAQVIEDNKKMNLLFFLSPLAFLIDYLHIFFEINQDGFYNFFQYERYYYFSGYFFYNIIIIYIIMANFKKIFR